MLYPKNQKPLTEADFKKPGSEYRATPFWAWNTKLEKDELVRQIEVFKELGYGGFHMHVRTGMATEYLSDEYMEMIGACVEKARQENMLAWLYDEDRWPSGAAGGLLTKDPAYRMRHLLLTRKPYGNIPVKITGLKNAGAVAKRCENGNLLACYDVVLDNDGNLASYTRIGENDSPKGFKLYAYAETSLPSPWYNHQTYADTLNPEAIKEFIRITYDRYAGLFQKDFGNVIPAIFTDEPQFSRKDTLKFAREDSDITLPWTEDLPQTYSAAYKGSDLIAGLPELMWNLPDGKISLTRYRYHDHVAERFAAAFADQCGDWCSAHNLMLTGHMMEEQTLGTQTHALGEAMRSYRSFQLPGIDILGDSRQLNTAKQAQSAARQYGCPGVLSELYGVCNWDFDFRGHKLQGDWQAAMGISVRVPHLSWVSMNGEAKRDYPGSFNYQAPWYREYPYVEDHFARLAATLTRGRAVCTVGVIHPIESYWLHWGPRDSTEAVRAAMDEKFHLLSHWLLRGFIDFDYICESTLPEQCDVSNIKKQFPVGKMQYDVIVVPAMQTIRASTMDRLEAFRKQGGKLIFMGPPPTHIDALQDDRGQKLWEHSEHIGYESLPLLQALETYRDVRIRDSSGAACRRFLYQMREEADHEGSPVRWLFICHADREHNIDNPQADNYRIQIKGEFQVTEYNTLNGNITGIDAEVTEGWTTITTRLWDHDSLLVRLTSKTGKAAPPAPRPLSPTSSLLPPTSLVPVTLAEPNVLVLDMAEYALDGGTWQGTEEILRLDNKLRGTLGWSLRGESIAQPWVEHDASTPHTLSLRFTIESETEIKGTELALENAAITKVTLNGQPAAAPDGWYTDKCIGKVKLPEITAGTNILELQLPYGKKIDVEVCYLLGDFSVKVQGVHCTLGPPVTALAFGDICHQGLPFYGGNLTYHLEVECGSCIIEASSYRFMLLKVAVDGADRGVIAYAPYQLTIDGLSQGKHKIDITGYGCRVNTFGQLHNRWGHLPYYGWGPYSWRTQGAAWSYEYNLWTQGVLKSPEIYIL